jgi:hypothetical protein
MSKKRLRHLVDATLVAVIFVSAFVYYGNHYRTNEPKFLFYQKYFWSAVNLYCGLSPDVRRANLWVEEPNERINIAQISCEEIARSPKLESAYFNGWHDTHALLSTLIAYNWRWLGPSWEALWPIAGALAALAIVAFYLIMRCFGVPWFLAAIILPLVIPYEFFLRNFYFLRDFAKVPFILLALAPLGLLFGPTVSYRGRLTVLAGSTCVIAIGMGFRQDAIVLLPAIVAAAAISFPWKSGAGAARFGAEMIAIATSFYLVNQAIGLLNTGQIAQLQGYPHFLVQGFSDEFWVNSKTTVPGRTFIVQYSDTLTWAAVDANSSEKVDYFTSYDPAYTRSGFDLIAKYAGLSIAEMIVRVFRALSDTALVHWQIQTVGWWCFLLLALVVVRNWRLSSFLGFAVLSLVAAGSLQYSPRHGIHFIMMDRILLAIIFVALARGILATGREPLQWRLAIASGAGIAGLLAVVVAGAFLIETANIRKLATVLEAQRWFASEAEYKAHYPDRAESVTRLTIDPEQCPGAKIVATFSFNGQKLPRPIEALDGTRRNVYVANYDPERAKSSVDVSPAACVAAQAWALLGDGVVTPIQLFDPEAALQRITILELLHDLFSSFF